VKQGKARHTIYGPGSLLVTHRPARAFVTACNFGSKPNLGATASVAHSSRGYMDFGAEHLILCRIAFWCNAVQSLQSLLAGYCQTSVKRPRSKAGAFSYSAFLLQKRDF